MAVNCEWTTLGELRKRLGALVLACSRIIDMDYAPYGTLDRIIEN
jgi:hypothetical protein